MTQVPTVPYVWKHHCLELNGIEWVPPTLRLSMIQADRRGLTILWGVVVILVLMFKLQLKRAYKCS